MADRKPNKEDREVRIPEEEPQKPERQSSHKRNHDNHASSSGRPPIQWPKTIFELWAPKAMTQNLRREKSSKAKIPPERRERREVPERRRHERRSSHKTHRTHGERDKSRARAEHEEPRRADRHAKAKADSETGYLINGDYEYDAQKADIGALPQLSNEAPRTHAHLFAQKAFKDKSRIILNPGETRVEENDRLDSMEARICTGSNFIVVVTTKYSMLANIHPDWTRQQIKAELIDVGGALARYDMGGSSDPGRLFLIKGVYNDFDANKMGSMVNVHRFYFLLDLLVYANEHKLQWSGEITQGSFVVQHGEEASCQFSIGIFAQPKGLPRLEITDCEGTHHYSTIPHDGASRAVNNKKGTNTSANENIPKPTTARKATVESNKDTKAANSFGFGAGDTKKGRNINPDENTKPTNAKKATIDSNEDTGETTSESTEKGANPFSFGAGDINANKGSNTNPVNGKNAPVESDANAKKTVANGSKEAANLFGFGAGDIKNGSNTNSEQNSKPLTDADKVSALFGNENANKTTTTNGKESANPFGFGPKPPNGNEKADENANKMTTGSKEGTSSFSFGAGDTNGKKATVEDTNNTNTTGSKEGNPNPLSFASGNGSGKKK